MENFLCHPLRSTISSLNLPNVRRPWTSYSPPFFPSTPRKRVRSPHSSGQGVVIMVRNFMTSLVNNPSTHAQYVHFPTFLPHPVPRWRLPTRQGQSISSPRPAHTSHVLRYIVGWSSLDSRGLNFPWRVFCFSEHTPRRFSSRAPSKLNLNVRYGTR
jgi:hypothetical protein